MGFTGHPLALSAPGRSPSETGPVITCSGPLSLRLSVLPLILNRKSLQDLRRGNLPHPAVRPAYLIQLYPVAPLSHGSPAGSHVAVRSRPLLSWCRRIGEFVALHEFFFLTIPPPPETSKIPKRGSPPIRGCPLKIYGKMFGLHEPALSSVKQPVGRAGTNPEHLAGI